MVHNRILGFWTDPVYLGPLVLCRSVLGLVLMAVGMLWIKDLSIWFAPDAIWPIVTVAEEGLGLVQPLLPGSTTAALLWCIVLILSGAGITLGLFTPYSTGVGLLALIVLQEKQPYILHGGDLLLRALVFGLLFSPAGKMLSADAMRHKESHHLAPPWGFRLMQVQVSIVYASTALWKALGDAWWNGEAIWRSWHIADFARWDLAPSLPPELLAIVLSVSVVMIEILLAGLLFMRGSMQKTVWLLGLALQLGIFSMMVLEIFPWVSLAALLLFMPAPWCKAVFFWTSKEWQKLWPRTLAEEVV